MYKLLIILSVFLITSCANSPSYLRSEENILRQTMSPIKKILPPNVDMKIEAVSKGWDNTEYFKITKVTAVRNGSLQSRKCYTLKKSKPNSLCEQGVSEFRLLPNDEYIVAIGLRSYNKLMSKSYYKPKNEWYEISGLTRASWPLWATQKNTFMKLANLSQQYLVNQKRVASELGYSNFNNVPIPLEIGKEYSFSDMETLLISSSKQEQLKTQLLAWHEENLKIKKTKQKQREIALAYAKSREEQRKKQVLIMEDKHREKQEEYQNAIFANKTVWEQRLESNRLIGEQVCTKKNQLGFVEQVNGDKVKVLLKGKLTSSFSSNYFFGGKSFKEFQAVRFKMNTLNDIYWFDKHDVAPCTFSIG